MDGHGGSSTGAYSRPGPGAGRVDDPAGASAAPYPPIEDYAFLSDCHSSALVSRTGSIDWACMPRADEGSCFGRLLDWDRGGYCAIGPAHPEPCTSRRYVDGLVLETTFRTDQGTLVLTDCYVMREGGAEDPERMLLRVAEVTDGSVPVRVVVEPRFDHGGAAWLRSHEDGLHSALGGDDGLVIWCDHDLDLDDRASAVTGEARLDAGERLRLAIRYDSAHHVDRSVGEAPGADTVDDLVAGTLEWWRTWLNRSDRLPDVDGDGEPEATVIRSATVLEGLRHAPTGAVAAAATTSLPESPNGGRTWDYRYSWIRDSWMSVRTLHTLGFHRAADGFRRFVQRASAGRVEALQVVYGLGGEREIPERTLDLSGWRGLGPVRIGNGATGQRQNDTYGYLLDLTWRTWQQGEDPGPEYWTFLTRVVEQARRTWREPDRGIWEVRGTPRHFVHSLVMCWTAFDRGLGLAEHFDGDAPVKAWSTARDEVIEAIEAVGYDPNRNTYRSHLLGESVDAALLLLPTVGYVAYDDERMVGTVDAIIEDLGTDGLLRRYRAADGLEGDEGVFLPCTFWLVECLARQGRMDEAEQWYDRATATANDLGLYAEEWDPATHSMLGNFPQALTHLSHIGATLALAGVDT
ncbi:MAG: glycoside hydrolase family 15 protein [Actinomycetota bacterium]|nr:glycoside hydrolase family 15 protein [Actinomycetota bacterium]